MKTLLVGGVVLLLAACQPAAATTQSGTATKSGVVSTQPGMVATKPAGVATQPGLAATKPAGTAVATKAGTAQVPVTGGLYGSTTAASSNTMVKVSTDPTRGKYLVDQNGMTLYVFDKDTKNTSTCSGQCAQTWPPLLTTGTTAQGSSDVTGTLGVITRDDGTKQITINGMPLYNYSADKSAGQTNGEGVGQVWYMVGPDGTELK